MYMNHFTWRFHTLLCVPRSLLGLLLSGACLGAQPALQITSPPDGTVVAPNQTVTVMVTASGGSFTKLGLIGQNPIGFSQPLTAPPYQFTIIMPADISPGSYAVTAAGALAPGEIVTSPPINLIVEPLMSPQFLRVEPTTLANLSVGAQVPLRVIGKFSDGSSVDVTNSTRTTYSSSLTSVAVVNSSGLVTATGPGIAKIVINGSMSVPVTVLPPVAIVPATARLYGGQTQRFVPQVRVKGGAGVAWSVNPTVGTITSAGVYTAPASITSQQQVNIIATSVANSTMSALATVTLYPPIAVAVAPTTVALRSSQTQQFTATVTNSPNGAVTWSLTPSVGSINGSGLYTAPSSISATQTVTLKATSVVDATKSGIATITLRKSN